MDLVVDLLAGVRGHLFIVLAVDQQKWARVDPPRRLQDVQPVDQLGDRVDVGTRRYSGHQRRSVPSLDYRYFFHEDRKLSFADGRDCHYGRDVLQVGRGVDRQPATQTNPSDGDAERVDVVAALQIRQGSRYIVKYVGVHFATA